MKGKESHQKGKILRKRELNLPKSRVRFRIAAVASRLEHRRIGQ